MLPSRVPVVVYIVRVILTNGYNHSLGYDVVGRTQVGIEKDGDACWEKESHREVLDDRTTKCSGKNKEKARERNIEHMKLRP